MLEKTLESPLDCKEIQPVHPRGNQSWVFIVRTDVEAETPIFWPPDEKSWLIWKDPDVGKDWRLEEKGTTEDEMIGRHHRLNGHVFGWTLGAGDGQGGLACSSSWGRKKSDRTEWLNWTETQLFNCFYLNILMYEVWWNVHLQFLNVFTLYINILPITNSSKFITTFREISCLSLWFLTYVCYILCYFLFLFFEFNLLTLSQFLSE